MWPFPVAGLQAAVPNAEILLFGAEDMLCNLHAPNERRVIDEFRKTVIAWSGSWRGFPLDLCRRCRALAILWALRNSSRTGASAPNVVTRIPGWIKARCSGEDLCLLVLKLVVGEDTG